MKVLLLIKYILFCSLFILLRRGRDPRFLAHGGRLCEDSSWSPLVSGDAQSVLIYAYETHPQDVHVTMEPDLCDVDIIHTDVTIVGYVGLQRWEHRTGLRTPSGVRANQFPGSFSSREYMSMIHTVSLMYTLYKHTLLTLNEFRVHVIYNLYIKTIFWLITTGAIILLTTCSICNWPLDFITECQYVKCIDLDLLSFCMCVHSCMIIANLDVLQFDTQSQRFRSHTDCWNSADAAWGAFRLAWCLYPGVDTDYFALPCRPGVVSVLLPICCMVSYGGGYQRLIESLPRPAYKIVHMCLIFPLYDHVQHHFDLSLVSRCADSGCEEWPHRVGRCCFDDALVFVGKALYPCQALSTMPQRYMVEFRWIDMLWSILFIILLTIFCWYIVYFLLLFCVLHGINIPIDVYLHHDSNFYSLLCLKTGPCSRSWLSEVLGTPDGVSRGEKCQERFT